MPALGLITWLLTGIGALLLFLVLVLMVEIFAGCRRVRDVTGTEVPPGKIAVIVPAHDEAAGVAQVIRAIRADLRPADRLIVVADNCTDKTFELAQTSGAEAIRRDDPARRGKGFALDFGVRHLKSDPPDVVIVMDADCFAAKGSLLRIAAIAAARQRPVQALYEMDPPAQAPASSELVAAFAWHVKNRVRPLGLHRLGLPCSLMGTGMAFPWNCISTAQLGTAHIVEDLVLGLELTSKGTPPLFCPQARVTSTFPMSLEGQKTQRARWETGHLNLIMHDLPRLLVQAVRTRNTALIAHVIDCAVPPLAVLLLLILWLMILSLLPFIAGWSALPLIMSALCLAVFAASILVAWQQTFRDQLSLVKLISVPGYIIGKLGIYCRVAIGRQLEWVRTKRD